MERDKEYDDYNPHHDDEASEMDHLTPQHHDKPRNYGGAPTSHYHTVESGEWGGVTTAHYKNIVHRATRRIALAFDVYIPLPNMPAFVEPLYIYLSHLRALLIFIVMGMAFFEIPRWCLIHPDDCARSDIFMNSNLPKFQPIVTDGVQVICLVLLLAEMGLRYRLVGRDFFLMNRTLFLHTILLSILLFDTLLALVSPLYRAHIWLSPFIRPWLFVVMFAGVRSTFWQIVRIIPLIFELLVLLFLLLISAAWLGLILFFDQEDNVPAGGPGGKHYFDTFGDSLLNIFIFLTTANSPDVRMPVYTRHRSTVWFFCIFLILGLYFLLPFIFSTVYNSYKSVIADSEKQMNKRNDKHLTFAFALLDRKRSDTVDLSVVEHVLEDLAKFSSVPPIHSVNALLSRDEEADQINLEEFLELFAIVSHIYRHPEGASDVTGFTQVVKEQSEWIETLARRHNAFIENNSLLRTIRHVVAHPRFDLAVDVLLIFNGVFFALQTYFFIEDAFSSAKYERWVNASEIVEWTFTILWTLEMVLKITVFGLRGYCSSYKNLFDAFVTISGLITSIMLQFDLVTNRLVRAIMIVRCMRLLRLFTRIRKFRIIFSAIVTLMPVFAALVGMLIVQFYFFAFLGIRFFGGTMWVGNPQLAGSAYDGAGYYANNWNDFGSAIVVLFDLMVVNNWFIYMDAAAMVTNEVSRVYFFMFWFFTNLLTLNLLVANILDVVSAVLDKEKEEDAAKDNARKLAELDDGNNPDDPGAPEESPEQAEMRVKQERARMRLAKARAEIEIDRLVGM